MLGTTGKVLLSNEFVSNKNPNVEVLLEIPKMMQNRKDFYSDSFRKSNNLSPPPPAPPTNLVINLDVSY